MNFFSHKIANPAGNGPSWDQWVNDLLTKTAREQKPDCEDDPRCEERSTCINDDNDEGAGQSYQDGESVDGKEEQKEGSPRKDKGGKTAAVVTAKEKEKSKGKGGKGKDIGECGNAGKVTEEHTDAAPDEDGQAATMINNDPNYQKGESVNPGKIDGKNKKGPGDKVVGKGKGKSEKKQDKKSSAQPQFKKIASLNRQEKVALMLSLTQNKNNPIEYVEAMVGLKVANLTEEEKAFLRKFWETIYDADYVNAMLADR
jgi:hypothetical protein